MIKIRLKFSKYGPIRFVGHLDVMRYFQKVMRRAGVPIAYSEGYSPHQLMSFAQPLSVGATSDGEYADIVLNDDLLPEKETSASGNALPAPADDPQAFCRVLTKRLNAVCHEGITILDARVLPEKAENAMTAVAACAWRAAFRTEMLPMSATNGNSPHAPFAEKLSKSRFEAFLAQERIPVQKKSKKGLKETDIKPMIYRAVLSEDGTFDLLLKSGSEDNLKPALLLGAFLRFLGEDREELFLQGDELKPEQIRLHRKETYRNQTEADGTVSLTEL